MSVAQLTARELAFFAAVPAHLELAPLDQLCQLAEVVSRSNKVAYAARYGEIIDSVGYDEIHAIASSLIGDEDELIASGGSCIAGNIDGGDDKLAIGVQHVEDAANRWIASKQRELQHAEENAVAFNDVGQQPTMTKSEVDAECLSLGYSRVIVAEFHVDQSDSMSDYFGGRQTRTVVIGYGKGKRESFKQLREAAAGFKPTECFGPGKGVFTARVVYADTYRIGSGIHMYKGSRSPWHCDMGSGKEFDTLEAANAFIEYAGKPNNVIDGETVCEFAWDVSEDKIEHRENYSMGGGNYLGFSRHGGWQVSSYIASEIRNGERLVEVHSFNRVPVKTAKPAAKAKPTAEVVQHEVEDGTHCVTVKAGKRKIVVVYSEGRTTNISVITGRSRLGKWFGSWERAKAGYRTANIKSAIQTAENAVSTRLAESNDSVAEKETEAVSVDLSELDVFVWL